MSNHDYTALDLIEPVAVVSPPTAYVCDVANWLALPSAAPLALAVAGWLHEKQAAPRTVAAYRTELRRFRRLLQRANLDLEDDARTVALAAQVYAAATPRQLATLDEGPVQPAIKEPQADQLVSDATHNKRLAAVSSFYRYALRMGLLIENPIVRVKRRTTQPYGKVQALDIDEVRERLAAIDRTTLAGQRDYALLAVALATGRRLAELAGLRLGDLHDHRAGAITITWRRVKGGATQRDKLLPDLARELRTYVRAVYGVRWRTHTHDAPVWVSVSNHHRDGALSVSAIGDICQQHLGTSKVHQLRHTFAQLMLAEGASPTVIQKRLGHKHLATTAIYLEQLAGDDNPFAEQLLLAIGVG